MNETVVVYADEQPPDGWHASVFLAGPTPRDPAHPSWRPEAVRALAEGWRGPGTLVVFVPEPRGEVWTYYDAQIAWEAHYLSTADVIAFWVPRDMARFPGLTTNVEFGRFEASGRVVLGTPDEAVNVRYLRYYAAQHGAPVRNTLAATMRTALHEIGDGAYRDGGRRDVPLLLWRDPVFQRWLPDDLRGGRVEWHRPGAATIFSTDDELVAFHGDSFTVLRR